jgi:hypothetical protein
MEFATFKKEDEMNSGPFHTAGTPSTATTPSSSNYDGAVGGGSRAYSTQATESQLASPPAVTSAPRDAQPSAPPMPEANSKLAMELKQFAKLATDLRANVSPARDFRERCQQAFEIANDLFGHAPTWICFYRELMGGNGMIHLLFDNDDDFGAFLRTDQYHQIQLMLTGLRSRDLPENDPNDPQRMITVRLPKSLHEAMCEEAGRLNISVNRLCISRMLQLLDPKMIPETTSKPRGRKPRLRESRTAPKS